MTAFIFDRRDPKRLLVASDTLGYSLSKQPKPLGFAAKIVPIPHLRGALAGRGAMSINASAACHLMLRADLVSFGDIVDALPGILRGVTAQYSEQQGIADPDSLMLAESLWAGWNEATGRCEVIAFRNFENYEPVPDDGAAGVSCLPLITPEYIPKGLAQVPPEQALIALMQAMRRFLADHPEVVPALVGGEICLTTVEETGVTSTILHRFEDFETVRHAAAAVRGRIERGEDTIDIEAGVCRVDGMIDADQYVAAAAANTAAPSPGGTRAERRRAEKAARKGPRRAA